MAHVLLQQRFITLQARTLVLDRDDAGNRHSLRNWSYEMDPLQVLATFAVCAIPILIAFRGQREPD